MPKQPDIFQLEKDLQEEFVAANQMSYGNSVILAGLTTAIIPVAAFVPVVGTVVAGLGAVAASALFSNQLKYERKVDTLRQRYNLALTDSETSEAPDAIGQELVEIGTQLKSLVDGNKVGQFVGSALNSVGRQRT